MHTLNISEFEHYDAKSIYAYIMMQSETEFKILLHKEYCKPHCDNFDITWEYHLAAYIGQKLFELSDAFAYYVPSIYRKQAFVFDITTKDLEKLADNLFFIITGLYETDLGTTIKFHEGATKLFTEAFEKEELDIACFGLLEIANKHLD